MQGSQNSLLACAHPAVQAPIMTPSEAPVLFPEPQLWKPGLPWTPPPTPAQAAARCIERGCVFPAASQGRCLHHERQAREPILFSSHQPTHLVLEQGRFTLPQEEIDTSRSRDRRKLAALRESFLEE